MFSPSANMMYARTKMPKSRMSLSGSTNSGTSATTISSASASATLSLWRASESLRTLGIGSAGFPGFLADQPLRPEDHDQHEVGEHDHGRPVLPDAVVRDLLDAADDDAAEDADLDVSDRAHQL